MSLTSLLPFASAVGASAMALGVLARRRRLAADWAFAAAMFALAAAQACAGLAARGPLGLAARVGWEQGRLTALAFLPGFWLLFSLGYARGEARAFLAKGRILLGAAFLLPLTVALAFRGSLIVSLHEGAVGGPWTFGLGLPGVGLSLLVLVGAVLVLMNIERTYRASVGTVRWRIKYMLMGVGLVMLVQAFLASQALLFRRTDTSLDSLDAATVLVAALLMLRSSLRSGMADLDVYPSRSLLQGSVTVLLAGIYLVAVGICAIGVSRLGGGNVFALESFLALLSLVLLVVLLQSDRLRRRLRGFVSRNFQRPSHDYRTVWRKFAEVAPARDPVALCRSLVDLTAEVFQALSVAIWLVEDGRLSLAASTSLSEKRGLGLVPPQTETAAILGYFRENPEPVGIEALPGGWAPALRRLLPSEFPKAGSRVCLPMIVRGDVAALMILGDRVGGADFSTQDLEMLVCVGDHATASMANVRQAQRLLQARELEAFQVMAAFFVHDLKNAASTLALMLENLPVHFDDPAFREDALRGISKSVAHINHVIGRLSLLRHELAIRPAESDLCAVVREAIAGLESDPRFRVATEPSPPLTLSLDREQMGKVVTNLVLNARDSMGGQGEVRVAVSAEPGYAVLSVADQGCGMSADFISRSLFRPFQTTKKNGLGIGMFQSRMIVERHGGRISVASEPGRGTTFRVMLPLDRTGHA